MTLEMNTLMIEYQYHSSDLKIVKSKFLKKLQKQKLLRDW
jgi:hypothetical protein